MILISYVKSIKKKPIKNKCKVNVLHKSIALFETFDGIKKTYVSKSKFILYFSETQLLQIGL